MTCAAAPSGGADVDFVDVKTGEAQAFCKWRVGSGGPDRQNALRPQRRPSHFQSGQVVERIIGLADQALRTVIDIQQDRVERPRVRAHYVENVALQYARTRIIQAAGKD